MIRLTFDLEIYPPLRDDNDFRCELVHTINSLLDMVNECEALVTFFSTGEFALRYVDALKRILAMGNEVGNHTMFHVPFGNTTRDEFVAGIAKCNNVLSQSLNWKPVGFRAPGGNVPLDIANELSNLDFLYDSSICRTYIPGWYEGGLSPTVPYTPSLSNVRRRSSVASPFVEIPISTFPCLPVPLGGFFLASLPILTEKHITRMCQNRTDFVMYAHLIDLMSLRGKRRYPWDFARIQGRVSSTVRRVLNNMRGTDMRLCALAKTYLAERSMQRDSPGLNHR